MTYTYTASHFFDGVQLHSATTISVTDGVISSIEPYGGNPDFHLVSVGLIDLQMNGFINVDVSRATINQLKELDRQLLQCGTTSWLATIVTAPLERLSASIGVLHDFVSSTESGCCGIHIEGPFLGGAPGAHNPEWIIPFTEEWYKTLPESVALMTVAPEQDGADQHISALVQQGVVVSLGHTRATHSQFNAAIDAGATMVTHLFNGMTGVHHREDGVALSALTDSTVTAGLIADLVHVSPKAIALAFSAKAPDGICLVSDSVAWDSEWATRRGISIVDGAPRLPDGTLAGSSTPLAECVRNTFEKCGVPLESALRAATHTPARLIGYPQMGEVRVGHRADLVAFNNELSVVEARRGLVSIRA